MITYTQPPQNVVYAMDKNGIGHIKIAFKATGKDVKLELNNLTTKEKIPVVLKVENATDYSAQLDLPKGDYQYIISEIPLEQSLVPIPPIEINFSVGRVLVVMGHSLANCNGEKWVTDKRVRIVENYDAKTQLKFRDEALYKNQQYRTCQEIWEEKKSLPEGERREYEIGIWGILAEKIAQRDECSVAIVNVAMGGSSVKMWADEAMSRPFNHGFGAADPNVPDQTLYNSGIPYFHLHNVLKHIVNSTGVTSVLCMHGENDMSTDTQTLAKYYTEVITSARTVIPDLPFVLGKSAWLVNSAKGVTQANIDNVLAAVDETVKANKNVFVGADSHLLPMSYRGLNNADDEHFNSDGGKEVARLWSLVLTNDFLNNLSKEVVAISTPDKTTVVNNPLITASDDVATQFQFPFIAALFILVLTVVLRLTGMKIPTIFMLIITGSVFGGSYLVQKLIKS